MAVVHRVHQRVIGVAPDGRPYAANDPHLLRWVHVAEVDSFLTAYRRYGGSPLDRVGADAYVHDIAPIGAGARRRGPADLRRRAAPPARRVPR